MTIDELILNLYGVSNQLMMATQALAIGGQHVAADHMREAGISTLHAIAELVKQREARVS